MKSFGKLSKANDPNIYIQEDKLRLNPIHQPFGLDHYAIIIISSGECSVKVNLDTYTLKKNQVLISPPNCIFHFLSIDDNLTFKIISFSPHLVDEMEVYRNHADQFKFLAFKYPNIITMDNQQTASISEMVEILKRKTEPANEHPFKKEVILHALVILTFEISAALKGELNIQSNQLTRKEDLVRKFLELVHQYFKKEHQVGFYAERLAVTANYLSKTTKSEGGKSASEIIEDMLILEANILLRQPDISISQVADMLSFSDQFIFSKFFKSKTHASPVSFRQSL
ncbi:MAG: AraC family transcriptional regulator [Chryseobacterium sp.]|nr:MAG: AraC family transcriptional regulator [Chryseobacterium sp.]